MATLSTRLEKIAAQAASNRPEMDAAAAKVEALVRAEAARHRDTGELLASIHTVRGRIDRHVTTSDPTAMHKEFGHLAVEEKTQAARWVPGIFVFTNAARRAAA